MKDSKSAHSTPLKNSSLRCPNTCSVAPLSRQLPFLDMLCLAPCLLSSPVHLGCWYCQPMSLWTIGEAPAGILANRRLSTSSCWAMSGLVDTDQETISFVQKS